MSNDYTPRKEEDEAFALPPVPYWLMRYDTEAVEGYGAECAEAARAPLIARIAELEAEVIITAAALAQTNTECKRLRAEVEAKAGEVEALRAALSQCAAAVGARAAPDCSVEFLACVPREVELVVEKLRADAERYRWLRDSEDLDTIAEVFEFTPATGWDAAIDAARKGEGSEG